MIYSTFNILDIERNQNELPLYLTVELDRAQIEAGGLFRFLDCVYDEDESGVVTTCNSFNNFIQDSYQWFVTYEGEKPRTTEEFNIEKVLVISVFRYNHGPKMVGIAKRNKFSNKSSRAENIIIREKSTDAMVEHIRYVGNFGWAEVSGQLEKVFKKAYICSNYIDPYELKNLSGFEDIEISWDDMHYMQESKEKDEVIEMIAYGHMKI